MHRYEESEERREKKIKEGRGSGTGADWQAWIKYGEIASKGNKSRQIEGRHRRPVLTLSDVETSLLDVLDCDPRVKEIYDQYPLNREATLAIAEEIGVDHPRCTGTGTMLTMTSDFVVDYDGPKGVQRVPIQCKHTSNLRDFNTAEHMEIERRYWARQGLRLRIVTESDQCIPRAVRQNCEDLMQYRFLQLQPSEAAATLSFNERVELITARVSQATSRRTLNEMAHELATFTNSPVEKFTKVMFNLLYRRILQFDVRKPGLLSQDVLDIQSLTYAAASAGSASLTGAAQVPAALDPHGSQA